MTQPLQFLNKAITLFAFVLLLASAPAMGQITLALSDVSSTPSTATEVAVDISNVSVSDDVLAFRLEFTYDATLLTITGVNQSGTLSEGWFAAFNNSTAGTIILSAANSTPLTGSGTLIKFTGTTTAAEGSAPLSWVSVRLNAGSPEASTQDGQTSVFSNQPPTAVDETVNLNEDETKTITLKGNDPEGEALAFAIATGPTKGTLGTLTTVDATTAMVDYTPNSEYSGADSFTFTVSDGNGTATGTITLDIGAVNDAPTPQNDTYEIDEDTDLNVDAAGGVLSNDSDAENDALTANKVGDPASGSLTLNADGSFTYTPNADFFGQDSFTYEARDASKATSVTVTITVRPINDAPPASAITSPANGTSLTIGGTDENNAVDGSSTLTTFNWEAVTDVDGDAVTYSYVMSPDNTFSTFLLSQAFTSAAGLTLTVNQGAQIFDSIASNVAPGASVTVFHRITTSDGTLITQGTASELTLVRGTITANETGGVFPTSFALKGNYPNPFNPTTTVQFDLPEPATVKVEVLDLLGRVVLSLPPQAHGAGANRMVQLDAGALSSGIYLYRVIASGATRTHVQASTMTLLK